MLRYLIALIFVALLSFSFLFDGASSFNKLFNFRHISYYRDIKKIENELSDSLSTYSFDKLLPKFIQSGDSVSVDEAVALMFGALQHRGYQLRALDSLELLSDSLIEQKAWLKAITVAQACEQIFPLSVQALFTKWVAYSNLKDSLNEGHYHKKLIKVFKAMKLSGEKSDLKICHSRFAIKRYLSLECAGAIFKLEEESIDNVGNQVFLYSFMGFPENFIIPLKNN